MAPLFGAVLASVVNLPLLAQTASEYDLKAAFIYNFASFVDWPPEAFSSPDAPLTIGVLGDDPFGAVLDTLVAGARVKGRPLEVRRFPVWDDAALNCHILFVSQSERWRLRTVLERVEGAPVLTVSDVPGFAEAGGAIGLTTQNDYLGLAINPTSLRTAGLVVSSKLLRLARIVGGLDRP